MGKIIVGVDFSEGSDMAVTVALNVAQKFNEALQFVGVNEKDLSRQEIIDEIRRREKQNADILAKVSHEYILCNEDITDAISNQARKTDTSLVVVGATRIAGLQKNFLGQFSYALLSKSPVPVLSVRQDYKFDHSFRHILLPIDVTDTSRQKVPMAVRFAKAFGSTIHIVGVNSAATAEGRAAVKGYITQTKNYLDNQGIASTLEQVEVEGSVSQTVIAAAVKYQADLVLMMYNCGVSLIKYIAGSSDQRLLDEIRVPIIPIKPKQLHTIKI